LFPLILHAKNKKQNNTSPLPATNLTKNPATHPPTRYRHPIHTKAKQIPNNINSYRAPNPNKHQTLKTPKQEFCWCHFFLKTPFFFLKCPFFFFFLFFSLSLQGYSLAIITIFIFILFYFIYLFIYFSNFFDAAIQAIINQRN
jgi:hypothetical protein